MFLLSPWLYLSLMQDRYNYDDSRMRDLAALVILMLALDIRNILWIRPVCWAWLDRVYRLIFSHLENDYRKLFPPLFSWDFWSWSWQCVRMRASLRVMPEKGTSCNIAQNMPNSSGLLRTAWQANHNSAQPYPRPTCRPWHVSDRWPD